MAKVPGLPHEVGPDELVDLERLAVALACEAGRFVRDERPDLVQVAQTKSTALDVVTAMDTAAERLLRERLAQARPDDAILGEEGGSVAGSTGLTWVLDPIDGTVNYLYDIPAYAVSVAVVTGDPLVPGGWTPVAGAVASPRVGEVFHARLGGGAWVGPTDGPDQRGQGRRLAVTTRTELASALVGTGFGYDRERRDVQGRVARQVLRHVRDLRRIGSAALDLCSVAAGRLDGYYERGLQPWDLAAGMLVVTEAGGRVSGLAPGDPASYDMVVAGGDAAHTQLQALVGGLHAAYEGPAEAPATGPEQAAEQG